MSIDGPERRSQGFLAVLGPGILFAGTAVGVSHLVQSTRAGADHGLALLGIVLLANLVKYPAFLFGPRYAAATGTSLLEGYRRQGRPALVLYGLLTLGTMFTVEAAVTIVTAGLARHALGLTPSPLVIAAVLQGCCIAILVFGRFRLLDLVLKVCVAALTLSTLAATVLAVPRIDWGTARFWPEHWDRPTLLFTAALVGWMPSAIDVSVWHSLWTLEKARDRGRLATRREARLDFDIGYVGTAVLAVCFVLMGTALLHGSGVALADSAGGFAAQVVDLYAGTLGSWSRWLIALCALSVMFSTTLSVVDGFARALSVLGQRFRGPEASVAEDPVPTGRHPGYRVAMGLVAGGSLVILAGFQARLRALVDLATTLSFLTAPLLAILNHRAMLAPEVPLGHRPGPWLRLGSLLAIGAMSLFALGWLILPWTG